MVTGDLLWTGRAVSPSETAAQLLSIFEPTEAAPPIARLPTTPRFATTTRCRNSVAGIFIKIRSLPQYGNERRSRIGSTRGFDDHPSQQTVQLTQTRSPERKNILLIQRLPLLLMSIIDRTTTKIIKSFKSRICCLTSASPRRRIFIDSVISASSQ